MQRAGRPPAPPRAHYNARGAREQKARKQNAAVRGKKTPSMIGSAGPARGHFDGARHFLLQMYSREPRRGIISATPSLISKLIRQRLRAAYAIRSRPSYVCEHARARLLVGPLIAGLIRDVSRLAHNALSGLTLVLRARSSDPTGRYTVLGRADAFAPLDPFPRPRRLRRWPLFPGGRARSQFRPGLPSCWGHRCACIAIANLCRGTFIYISALR